MDNKGAVDPANSDMRMHFLREMEDRGLLQIKHLPGDDNPANIFTKNTSLKPIVGLSIFEHHLLGLSFVVVSRQLVGRF
jgi:hypothetical protein